MEPQEIIDKLSENATVFETLLSNVSDEEFRWKADEDSWSILEIICHLRDEEVEDFRSRIKVILTDPGKTPRSINPTSWVTERKYSEQIFEEKLASFLREREGSVLWLHSLDDADWDAYWEHPEKGPQSARHYLHNWLAHDYLHMRQIVKVRYDYLGQEGGLSLDYAGNWK